MLAQSMFSHKELQNLNGKQMQEKMFTEKGINWNDIETRFKRGSYIKRTKITKSFSKDEIDSLPPHHNARKNPDVIIERSVIEQIEYPVFNKINNKVDVIFHDLIPATDESFESIS